MTPLYRGRIYRRLSAHPLVKLSDEPQLRLQVGSVFLGGDVTQEVFVPHPRRQKNIPLVLPRLLILHTAESRVQVRQSPVTIACAT